MTHVHVHAGGVALGPLAQKLLSGLGVDGRLEEHADEEGGAKLLYRGKIIVDGGGGFERRWLVTVRQEPTGYRVTNYQELAE